MVTHPRATLGADELRALKLPIPVAVRADASGHPLSVQRDDWPAPREVARVQDSWRIDDEWWRERAVARLYYRVLLSSGAPLTLYHDLVDGRWYEQDYGRWRVPTRRRRGGRGGAPMEWVRLRHTDAPTADAGPALGPHP